MTLYWRGERDPGTQIASYSPVSSLVNMHTNTLDKILVPWPANLMLLYRLGHSFETNTATQI